MIRRPPRSTRTDTLFPYTTLFRSGYRKMVRLAAPLVAEGGFLLAASCSHHADLGSFAEQVRRGLVDSGREGRILRTSGAAVDHPVHPALPESAYLKAQTIALDRSEERRVGKECVSTGRSRG